jgi:hypothetical protein
MLLPACATGLFIALSTLTAGGVKSSPMRHMP